ncbi:MAG: hypothetical protein PPFGHCPK_00616 [Spiroplasma endosymbiont of Drosophila atripex]|nr:MAG: hypothetical protein PPFGHCPK_00616 [Spiroplasma endosymbiont of Drosophila atripex]
MKLIVILIIIMSIIFLIGFIIIFFLKLRKKKIKSSRKIKYRLCDPNSYHSSIIKNRKFKSNNDLVNNKKILEMLTYLQERDIANYNNIIPTFYSILEKPIQHNLEANKNANYLLTNIVDILCHHHHCIVNTLHLIKHLFNKCNNKLHQHKKHSHFTQENNHSVKPTHVFNKTQTNASTPKTNVSIPKKHNKHTFS